ncbi:hypothetical protein BSLG_005717 [Batrachochytrium salamandrivorans]|nr:hypothetical protein BSLG_005717 [Batrachochytrium salamandrivorans]
MLIHTLGRIALDLIKEFLQFYKLDQTLSVLNPECGLTTTSHPIIPARSAINTDSSIQPSYTNPSTVSDSSNLPLTNTPSTLASIPPHFASSSSVTQSLASKPLPSHISALAPPKPSLLPIPSLNSSLPTSSGTLNSSIPGVLADVTPPNTSSVSTTLPIPTPNSTVKPTDSQSDYVTSDRSITPTHAGDKLDYIEDSTPVYNSRRVFVNLPLPSQLAHPDGTPIQVYPPNTIRTSKYTLLSFIPKNLFEQFRRAANTFNNKQHPYSTQDKHDESKTWPSDPNWETVTWGQLRVGDIIMLSENESIPADIVILSSSDATGIAYVETKIWMNILLRGAVVRNVDHIIGVVISTGSDTKVVMNSGSTPSPRSNIEKAWTSKSACIIMMQNIVPISLYVSLEVMKSFQSYFIYQDIDMYDTESDSPCIPKSWNITDDLGQIEYLFSDKTGTLTQNKMEFRRCSINGVIYGQELTHSFSETPVTHMLQDHSESLLKGTRKYMDDVYTNPMMSKDASFVDDSLFRDYLNDPIQKQCIIDMFTVLSVCYTVPTPTHHATKMLHYSAQSPDEGALVSGAKMLDLPFTTICQRLASGQDAMVESVLKHLSCFATEGLCTLCIAQRILSEAEYSNWLTVQKEASVALSGRDQLLDAAAEMIEKELVLLGATAIEDKLQDGVPQTISILREAGLRIWVLTGDKLETAINIDIHPTYYLRI